MKKTLAIGIPYLAILVGGMIAAMLFLPQPLGF